MRPMISSTTRAAPRSHLNSSVTDSKTDRFFFEVQIPPRGFLFGLFWMRNVYAGLHAVRTGPHGRTPYRTEWPARNETRKCARARGDGNKIAKSRWRQELFAAVGGLTASQNAKAAKRFGRPIRFAAAVSCALSGCPNSLAPSATPRQPTHPRPGRGEKSVGHWKGFKTIDIYDMPMNNLLANGMRFSFLIYN